MAYGLQLIRAADNARNRVVMKILRVILLFCCILVNSALVMAVEKSGSWDVCSEYSSPFPGGSKSVVVWHFVMGKLQNGKSQVTVSDREQHSRARAELFYDSQECLERAVCIRFQQGAEIEEAVSFDPLKPALIKQTIIPVDWLNISWEKIVAGDIGEFIVKERVGNSQFSTHLKVSTIKLSRTEAEAQGMLLEYNRKLAGGVGLRLVEVAQILGPNSKIILRQLWGDAQEFWLYEEKEGRRSWRLAQFE